MPKHLGFTPADDILILGVWKASKLRGQRKLALIASRLAEMHADDGTTFTPQAVDSRRSYLRERTRTAKKLAPKEPTPRQPWTDEDERRLAKMWNDGVDVDAIARILKRTRIQIKDKRRYLLLKPRAMLKHPDGRRDIEQKFWTSPEQRLAIADAAKADGVSASAWLYTLVASELERRKRSRPVRYVGWTGDAA